MLKRIFDQFLLSHKISTDTRKIEKDSIFFALKGANFNGNEFALQALQSGAAMSVVDEPVGVDHPQIVQVDDALKAMQDLSREYRRTLHIPFLAITGSNGKTTTKELVRDVMAKKFRVHATHGNLNNHIGVPLTLLSIPTNCEFAIIEMGANHQREIAGYCQYAEPDFGLVTNMGKAHLEGFGGVEGVKKGKKELYDYIHDHGGVSFVNTELENLKETSQGMKRVEYGFQSGDFKLELISESPVVTYLYADPSCKMEVKTNLAGAYNLYNIASAIVVGRYFDVEVDVIHDAISAYVPDNNRSQLTKTERNVLIMDAYNANPSSMEHALVSLANQQHPDKYFVIGDMRELGGESEVEHLKILHKAIELKLNGITVGDFFYQLRNEAPFPSFKNRDDARDFLKKETLKDKLILVKGSRGIRLEEVIAEL
jgi:UDP-N-acetylmuramoyl-tripeptide--D-alanyl-D-alanine ligase